MNERCRKQWYTVVLLYPDYMTETYGQETFNVHVLVDVSTPRATREAAIAAAQEDACSADGNGEARDPEDFFPVAVIKGQHINLA